MLEALEGNFAGGRRNGFPCSGRVERMPPTPLYDEETTVSRTLSLMSPILITVGAYNRSASFASQFRSPV